LKARAAATPVVLIALATGAASYAYLIDRGKVSDGERAARRREVFPSFRAEDVHRMKLDHGAEHLVIERDAEAGGSSWAMTSPLAEQADPAAVDALVRGLEAATWVRTVADGEALGLAAPRVTGEIEVGDLSYRFALGADAPHPDGAAYLKLDGEGTFVVGRSLVTQLLRGADAYRPRALVPFGGKDVAQIDVKRGEGTAFRLERHGATFRLRDGARASRAATERILLALADARAEPFLPDEDAEAAAATRAPALQVRVTGADPGGPNHVELLVGGACPGRPEAAVVVRTAPSRVSACVGTGLVEALGVDPASLADASPFFAHADEIEELRLEPVGAAGPAVEIARRGSSWHERAPEDRELGPEEADSANALAQAVASARGSDVHLPGPTEMPGVAARVSVVRTGGGTREVVELSRPGPDGAVLARRADDGAVLRLPLAVARRLLPHPAALRARSVWTEPFDPASVTAIEDTCGPAPERVELRDHAWTMLAPHGFAADPVTATDLASAVARAKADAWVAEGDDGTFGLASPGACTVSLSVASPSGGGTRRAAVVFGAAGEGGVYARTSDDPAVFIAPQSLHDLATHPAIDRSAFRIDPSTLASAKLDGANGRLLVDAGVTSLASAIGSLYAVAALHPGAAGKGEGFDHPTLTMELTTADRKTRRITVGAPAQVDGMDVYFARAADIDATFIVPRSPVAALLAGR
jgi:hypothetical protein